MVHHLGVERGLDIGSAVGDGGVGGVQLQVGHAVGDAAEGQGLRHVRIDLSADLFSVRQGGEAEIQQIIIACPGTDEGQRLDRYDVQGIGDSFPQGADAPVAGAVPVGNRTAAVIIKGRVHKHVRQRQSRAVQSGRIGGDDLERGAGLPRGRGGAVQRPVGLLRAASAHDGDHVAGGLILDGHGDLRLRRHGNIFRDHLSAALQQVGFIRLDRGVRLVL